VGGVVAPELRRGDDHLRVAPLAVRGELLGVLVARRGDGADDFDDADDEGLARVVRLVAAALQNAELDAELRRTVDELRRSNADLRASRARIVTVADDERRRPRARPPRRRPVPPDGHRRQVAAGPALVRADPRASARVLTRSSTTSRRRTPSCARSPTDLPAPAAHRAALGDAPAGVAAHAPIHVEVGEVTADRFDPQIEAAVYFCCAEAVQNAAKHAGSERPT
jgi:hypothetical protein